MTLDGVDFESAFIHQNSEFDIYFPEDFEIINK